MEAEIQAVFAIQLAVVGMAHLLQPAALVQFYRDLTSRREAGVVVIALMSQFIGSILVVLHNVWHGIPILLTIFGWAQLIKGTVYLLVPEIGLRQFERITVERTNLFRIPGILLLMIAALLAWNLVRQ